MRRRGRRNPGDDLTVVDLPTSWKGSGGVRLTPWEIRSDIFVFPPDEPARVATPEGVMEMRRPLTEEEVLRRRKYLEVRAFPHEPPDPLQKINFRNYVRLLWEVLGGVATTPRLPDWRKHRFAVGITDLESLYERWRPATSEETVMFMEWLDENRPDGLKL